MSQDFGDYLTTETVDIDLNAFDSNDPAASVTITDLAAGDIRIFKDGSLTQRTSANGVTIDIDFDANVGAHMVSIDLSDDTDAGFYIEGSRFQVMMVGTTVDAGTVTAWIGHFSIGLILRPTGIITSGSAAKVAAESYVLTTGTQSANTVAATSPLDGIKHEHTDTAGAMDLYYQFNTGGGTPNLVTMTGLLNGGNDDLEVYARNWITSAWVQIGTLAGKNNTTVNDIHTYDLFTNMVGTGNDFGKVRIRFTDGAFTLTTATLRIDQIFVTFSVPSGGYENGAVWINTNRANTNTVPNVDGVSTNPVSTMTALNILLASQNLKKVEVIPGSTLTFAASQNGQTFRGHDWTLELGGQSIVGSEFAGAEVSGVASGAGTTQVFEDCIMGATSHIKGTHIIRSGMAGTQTVAEAGNFFLANTHSSIAGTSTWVWDFGAAIGNSNLSMGLHANGVEIQNLNTTGTDNVSIAGIGQVILNANCADKAGSEVALRGNLKLTNNSTFGDSLGTLDINALISRPSINGGDYPLDTDANGRIRIVDGTAAGEIGLTSGSIDNVALVGTTTNNTDMRGTDSALLAADVNVTAGIIESNVKLLDGSAVQQTAGRIHAFDDAGAAIAAAAALATHDGKLDGIITTVGVAGLGLTDLGGMSTAMKAQVVVECGTALTAYDGPTNAEMIARTILAAAYFDPAADAVANVTAVGTLSGHTPQTGDSYAIVSSGTHGNAALLARGDIAWITGGSVSAADIADAVWDELQAGHIIAGSFGFYLDAQISLIAGAVGPGGTEWEIIITDGVNPIDNVRVWLTTDEIGSNTIANQISDADGSTNFMLDLDVTYYIWKEKAGFNFTNPEATTVT